MTAADIIPILPLVVLTAAAVAMLLLIAFWRNHAAAAALCVLGLALAFAAVPVAAARRVPIDVTPLIAVDGYALFFQGLVILAALAVALLSHGYFARRESVPREEYYVLLLTATLGAATIVASRHFASFFLGLETLSVSLVALVAYPAALERPVEAGLKYLILSGVSSALLLFGIALLYYMSGNLSLGAITLAAAHGGAAAPLTGSAPTLSGAASQLAGSLPPLQAAAPRLPGAPQPLPAALIQLYGLSGLALILDGIGFKLSIVPFHLWAPDVYEGAPAPVTAFVAVVSKTAVLALLLRYYLAAAAFGADPPLVILSAAAILSMIVGNLLALLQNNVKRILAYSSIAHLGYALVAFLAGGSLAIESVSFYLIAYAISTLGAFGVVAMMSHLPATGPVEFRGAADSPDGADFRDADDLDEYRGLFRSRPWLAATFTVMLLSLAGIPMTVGFIAKFYAITSGVGASLTAPIGALVAGSIIGLYYYLRIIVAMIQSRPSPPASVRSAARAPLAGAPLSTAVMTILVVLLIGLGLYPTPIVGVIRASATGLAGEEPGPLSARYGGTELGAPSAADSCYATHGCIGAGARVDARSPAGETARFHLHRGSALMTVKPDSVVSIHYTLKDDGGAVIDSSESGDPLTYLHGHGQLIPGLERQLEGKSAGDKLNVTIAPADGYGEYDDKLVQQIPRRTLKGIANVKVGMQLRAQTDEGPRTVTVTRVAGDLVTLDGNHPLAGKSLNFDVEVADVRDATAEELTHGHAHGPGEHHH